MPSEGTDFLHMDLPRPVHNLVFPTLINLFRQELRRCYFEIRACIRGHSTSSHDKLRVKNGLACCQTK